MSTAHNMVSYLVDTECTKKGWRTFRNPVGTAWVGKVAEDGYGTRKGRVSYTVELYDARAITFGLCKGSSDHIGWRPVLITPELVGMTVAQFLAIEAKTDSYSRTSEEQRNFLEQVARSGGCAMVARRVGGELELEEVK